MKPATYTMHASAKAPARVIVLRHDVHYPRGVHASKARTVAAAEYWIAMSVQEDKDNRARKIADYLAERAARPAYVAPVTDANHPDQLAFF